jgi:transcriptional regulator with XRE-family HTH domain
MGQELGDFLKSRRDRLRPRDVGLAGGRRRRTTGLRREEVAELAGIGVDWYTRLEQGRATKPSEGTLEALARALKLTKSEARHLRALVKGRERAAFVRETAPEPVRRMVEALNLPAYVTGRRFDVIAWNAAADAIFGFSGRREEDRNTLLYALTTAEGRELFGESWASEAQRLLALFRGAYDMFADDPAFVELVERLRAKCPEFEGWWARHEVRETAAGHKTLTRPEAGPLRFEYASFQSNDNPDLKLALFRPSADQSPQSLITTLNCACKPPAPGA